jgi:hypothetical protein
MIYEKLAKSYPHEALVIFFFPKMTSSIMIIISREVMVQHSLMMHEMNVIVPTIRSIMTVNWVPLYAKMLLNVMILAQPMRCGMA